MKKLSALIAALSVLLIFSGCGRSEEPGVTYPQEAPLPITVCQDSLTPEEAQLLDQDRDLPNGMTFSFRTRVPVTAWKLILLRLENGAWEDVAGGSWNEFHWDWDQEGVTSGKLLVEFQNLWEDFTVSSIAGNQVSGTSFHPGGEARGNSRVSYCSAVTEADFEELIPLVIQVTSLQDRLFTPGPDILDHPELYSGQDYEDVYLLAMALQEPEADAG